MLPKKAFPWFRFEIILPAQLKFVSFIDSPFSRWLKFFITQSVECVLLNVYLNGMLRKVHKFMGQPIFNKNHMYFNVPNTFNGSMFNFNYIPLTIDRFQVEQYSKDIPNVDLIPKSRRINNYVKRLKFNKAIQSFFI